MSNVQWLIFLAIVVGISFLCAKIASKFKVPKIPCVALVTGGVKSGKSTLSVYMAIQTYNRVHRRWKIRTFFQTLLHKPLDEEPLLYSNIPLAVPYVPITLELLQRKVRPRYCSVAYVNEASLLADQMLSLQKDDTNERLTLFNKLFGHETIGGVLIYDTQCVADVHYAVRRSLSSYVYVHHLEKRFPFFLIAQVREERYSDDRGTINTYNEDVENTLKKVLIPKRVWKKFDAYCFSCLTDGLPVADNVIEDCVDLKARNIVSFRQYKTINNKENKQ